MYKNQCLVWYFSYTPHNNEVVHENGKQRYFWFSAKAIVYLIIHRLQCITAARTRLARYLLRVWIVFQILFSNLFWKSMDILYFRKKIPNEIMRLLSACEKVNKIMHKKIVEGSQAAEEELYWTQNLQLKQGCAELLNVHCYWNLQDNIWTVSRKWFPERSNNSWFIRIKYIDKDLNPFPRCVEMKQGTDDKIIIKYDLQTLKFLKAFCSCYGSYFLFEASLAIVNIHTYKWNFYFRTFARLML